MELDVFFGGLSAIVFNFFMHGYILIGISTGIAFFSAWIYYRKERIQEELKGTKEALQFTVYKSKNLHAVLVQAKDQVLASAITLWKNLKNYYKTALLRLHVKQFLKRSRVVRVRHSI